MKTTFIMIAAFAAISLTQTLQAQERPEVTWEKTGEVTVPVPPDVHPRLYLLEKDIPELRERLENPEIKKTVETIFATPGSTSFPRASGTKNPPDCNRLKTNEAATNPKINFGNFSQTMPSEGSCRPAPVPRRAER